MPDALPHPRIVILGGGFSGAMVAANLLRAGPDPAQPGLHMDIVEPRPFLGCGTAYGTPDPSFRINVPAARMGVFADDPTGFDRWLRERDVPELDGNCVAADGALYPARAVFGRFVEETLAQQEAARPDATLVHHRAPAIEARTLPGGATAITLQDGTVLHADLLVLAMTHTPPALPPLLAPLAAPGAPPGLLLADPWDPDSLARIDSQATLMIMGTGLSMADLVTSLERRGHRGRILAFSRRGLLSRPPAAAPVVFALPSYTWAPSTLPRPPAPGTDWPAFDSEPAPATATGLLRAVRSRIAAATATGLPWQLVIDDVRAHGYRLWSALPLPAQRRLLRHARPYWDVHRFRAAPQAIAAIARLRASGQLVVLAARLRSIDIRGNRLDASLRPRAGGADIAWQADALLLATGPDNARVVATQPVLAMLEAQGALRADPTGLGIEVDPHSRTLDAHGAPTRILVSGPLARGRFGELMGLPQVADHAAHIARTARALLHDTALPDHVMGMDLPG